MIYGYIFTETQSELSEQQENMKHIGINDVDIIADCMQTEQKSERENLTKLIDRLHSGDLIYIPSLSHLGGNYGQILDTWKAITEGMQTDICVMDTDGLDTRRGKEAAGTLLADTVAEMLDFVNKNEHDKNKKRQQEGYLRAKSRGVRFGRPPKALPDDFESLAKKWTNREISGLDAAKQLEMPLSTFRYRAKQMGYDVPKRELEA